MIAHIGALVERWFQDRGLGTSVVYGFSAEGRQDNQGSGDANRIVFHPGDPQGKAGRFVGTRSPGGTNPRELFNFIATVRMTVWAVDSDRAENDAAQVSAVMCLWEKAIQAIHSVVGSGNYDLKDPQWEVSPNENPYGRALHTTIEIRMPIVDEAAGEAHPDKLEIDKAVVIPTFVSPYYTP